MCNGKRLYTERNTVKYDLVIWDWNGTLLDDVSASLRSVNDMLDRRNMERIDLVRYRECIGVPIRCFYEQVFDMEKEEYTSLLREYNDGYEYYVNLDCAVAPGAEELLGKIRNAGVRQILVSSCEKNQLADAIAKFDIGGYFDAVLGAEDFLATSKIDRAVDYVNSNMKPGAKILAVGDIIHDYDLAKTVGADCVLVKTGHENTKKIDSSGANIADTVAEVEKYL